MPHLTDEQIEALNPAQAAAWVIEEAPVTLQGFGANFFGAITRLIAVKTAAAQKAGRDQTLAEAADFTNAATNAVRRLTLGDAIILVDDAVALGEDPKAAIARERDLIPPTE